MGEGSKNYLNDANYFDLIYTGSGIWQSFGYSSIIYMAGIAGINPNLYEAAKMDGANRWQVLFHITLPMMRKLLFLAILLRAVDALRLFDTAFVLTQGGPGRATEFLSLHVYRMANAQNGLIGRAAAIALVLLVISTVISRFLIKQQRKEDD